MRDYKRVKLGEITRHIGGTPLEKYVDVESDYKFISIGNYTTNGEYIDNGSRIKYNEKTKEKILSKNDLVMVLNDKTTEGKIIGSTIFINEDNKYIYNQRSERIICNNEVNPRFLWHYINSFIFKKEVLKRIQGGTQIYVNYKDIEKIEINLPNLKEQNNIVDVLDGIDSIIEKHESLLEEKNQFIKSLFVEMFERGHYPKDEFINIAKEIYAGGDKPKDISKVKEGEYLYPVFANGYENEGLQGYSKVYRTGDSAVTISARGTIGYSFIRNEKFTPIVRLITIIPNEKANVVYLKYAIDNLNIAGSGTSQAQLTVPDIKKNKIIIPPIELQNKFADFVKQIDKQKFLLEKQKQNYENLKKALMQKLLTGKVRVKI